MKLYALIEVTPCLRSLKLPSHHPQRMILIALSFPQRPLTVATCMCAKVSDYQPIQTLKIVNTSRSRKSPVKTHETSQWITIKEGLNDPWVIKWELYLTTYHLWRNDLFLVRAKKVLEYKVRSLGLTEIWNNGFKTYVCWLLLDHVAGYMFRLQRNWYEFYRQNIRKIFVKKMIVGLFESQKWSKVRSRSRIKILVKIVVVQLCMYVCMCCYTDSLGVTRSFTLIFLFAYLLATDSSLESRASSRPGRCRRQTYGCIIVALRPICGGTSSSGAFTYETSVSEMKPATIPSLFS